MFLIDYGKVIYYSMPFIPMYMMSRGLEYIFYTTSSNDMLSQFTSYAAGGGDEHPKGNRWNTLDTLSWGKEEALSHHPKKCTKHWIATLGKYRFPSSSVVN